MDIDNLLKEFHTQVSDKEDAIDPGSAEDWHSIAIGWALAKGLVPLEALDFAWKVRYDE